MGDEQDAPSCLGTPRITPPGDRLIHSINASFSSGRRAEVAARPSSRIDVTDKFFHADRIKDPEDMILEP